MADGGRRRQNPRRQHRRRKWRRSGGAGHCTGRQRWIHLVWHVAGEGWLCRTARPGAANRHGNVAASAGHPTDRRDPDSNTRHSRYLRWPGNGLPANRLCHARGDLPCRRDQHRWAVVGGHVQPECTALLDRRQPNLCPPSDTSHRTDANQYAAPGCNQHTAPGADPYAPTKLSNPHQFWAGSKFGSRYRPGRPLPNAAVRALCAGRPDTEHLGHLA